jgi:predicted amidophosphoribosyltransferase
MSLTKCPACEKEVSPNAPACPRCGEPINKSAGKSAGAIDAKDPVHFIGLVIAGLMILGIIIFAIKVLG